MKMKKLIVAALLGIITTTKAMTITDNLIVWECPYCGAKASERELGSWNTFGAVFWSDCFRIAPMAPSQDIVSRCWKCNKVFAKWQAKHKSILEEKVPREDRRRIKWIGDYSAVKEVLDAWKGKLKPELECELRMRMLWAANHKYRKATLDASNERLVEGLRIDGITVPEAQENMLKLSSSTNLPMTFLPGIGAKMRIDMISRAIMRSFERPSTFATFVPGAGRYSNRVTTGPGHTLITSP